MANNGVVSNEVVAESRVEVVADELEQFIIMVSLTPVQIAAAKMMYLGDIGEKLDAIAKSTVASRIKGNFKSHREAVAKVAAEQYDTASRKGAKWDISKDAYLKRETEACAKIWNELA